MQLVLICELHSPHFMVSGAGSSFWASAGGLPLKNRFKDSNMLIIVLPASLTLEKAAVMYGNYANLSTI